MLLLLFASLTVLCADDLLARRRALRGHELALGLAGLATLLACLWQLRPELPMLEKTLGRLAMPAGLLFAAGWLASLLVLRRSPKQGTALFAGWLAFAAAGNECVGGALIGFLEAPYRDARPLAEAPFDAVFVLGGGVAATDDGEGQLAASGDRVLLGARLYHAGIAPLLFTSGRSVPGFGEPFESGPLTARIWRSLGVPEHAIEVIEGAYNTSMEIEAYARLVEERGYPRVGLVTSAWHMRRAMTLAARHGLSAVPLPADQRGGGAYHGLVSLVPTGTGFDLVHRAAWEMLGAAVGR